MFKIIFGNKKILVKKSENSLKIGKKFLHDATLRFNIEFGEF